MEALRQTLLLPLDDLLAVIREFINPRVPRSGLDHCLRRHGLSNLKALQPMEEGESTRTKTFKDHLPGFVHIDVKYLSQIPDERRRKYPFAAIDRASRWVYGGPARPAAFSSASSPPAGPRPKAWSSASSGASARCRSPPASTPPRAWPRRSSATCAIYNHQIPQKAIGHIPPRPCAAGPRRIRSY